RLASRQLDLAREQACDRAVLEKTGISQVNYAELLLSFGLSKRPRLAMAPQPSHLERRIHMVLNHPPSHRLARRRLVLAAFAVLGVVGSGLSFATPPTTTPGIAPKVDGALDPRVVQTLIATQAHDVEACYQAYVKEHAPTDGVLVLHWEVKDDGSVEETCQSSGTTVPMELGRCVSKRVATWTFPSPGYGQRAAIEYTFEFTSKRR
ncbi:MAG: AgmX/PglI C-terminal domain-containing protein, partial [Myxococcota bacterium]